MKIIYNIFIGLAFSVLLILNSACHTLGSKKRDPRELHYFANVIEFNNSTSVDRMAKVKGIHGEEEEFVFAPGSMILRENELVRVVKYPNTEKFIEKLYQ